MRRALKPVSLHKAPWSHNPNRNVFNDRLNCPRLSHSLKLSGNVFHRRGPAAAKHRSPKLLYVRPRCDGQRTSPCRLSGVGEHWHQRRVGSRQPDKQVRGRSNTGVGAECGTPLILILAASCELVCDV